MVRDRRQSKFLREDIDKISVFVSSSLNKSGSLLRIVIHISDQVNLRGIEWSGTCKRTPVDGDETKSFRECN